MLQRTEFLGKFITMLGFMIEEFIRFIKTFFLILIAFLVVKRFLANYLSMKSLEENSYWSLFLVLIYGIMGEPDFESHSNQG